MHSTPVQKTSRSRSLFYHFFFHEIHYGIITKQERSSTFCVQATYVLRRCLTILKLWPMTSTSFGETLMMFVVHNYLHVCLIIYLLTTEYVPTGTKSGDCWKVPDWIVSWTSGRALGRPGLSFIFVFHCL